MVKVISIINQKGGVGKTTTSVNVSSSIAAFGKRVLLIDIDSQCNTSTSFGLSYTKCQYTIYDVLSEVCTIGQACAETEIPNLKVIPAKPDLAACDVEFASKTRREFLLKDALRNVSCEYDYILIDCPPSLGLLSVNSLVASHSVIIPSQCEFYALEGLSRLLNTISLIRKSLNQSICVDGIILTMYDCRNKLTKQVEDEVRSRLRDKVFKTVIPRNVRLSEAPSYGVPAVIYDGECAGSRAYIKLSREILEKDGYI